jgi:hypothetical protein
MSPSGERGKKPDSKADKDGDKKNRNRDSSKEKKAIAKESIVPQDSISDFPILDCGPSGSKNLREFKRLLALYTSKNISPHLTCVIKQGKYVQPQEISVPLEFSLPHDRNAADAEAEDFDDEELEEREDDTEEEAVQRAALRDDIMIRRDTVRIMRTLLSQRDPFRL